LDPPGGKNVALFRQKQRTGDASRQIARSVVQTADSGATFSGKRRFRARNRRISGSRRSSRRCAYWLPAGVFGVSARKIGG